MTRKLYVNCPVCGSSKLEIKKHPKQKDIEFICKPCMLMFKLYRIKNEKEEEVENLDDENEENEEVKDNEKI